MRQCICVCVRVHFKVGKDLNCLEKYEKRKEMRMPAERFSYVEVESDYGRQQSEWVC